ncbi:MAG: Ig-like domain-containing protein [Clostridia bacterium]|nr:Ig-like domain-containing protein [Clostridia bacterium]
MNHNVKRALALMIALLLALPVLAHAEDAPLPAGDAPVADAPAAGDAGASEAEEMPGEETDEAPDADADEPAEEILVATPAEPEVAEASGQELAEDTEAEGFEAESPEAEADALLWESADDVPDEDAVPAETLAPVTEVVGAGRDDGDGDQLLDAYVQQMIDESLGLSGPLPLFAAGATLAGMNGIVYDILKSRVTRVAEGALSKTVFVITEEELRAEGVDLGPWTAASLGVSAVVSNGKINQEALSAVKAVTAFSTDKVINALLADCPSELYWYNKTKGISMGIPGMSVGASWNGTEYALYYKTAFSITLSMSVSAAYQDSGEYTVSAERVDTARRAIATARGIVESHSSGGARDRLAAYKNEICERVDYNHAAAGNGEAYGDPWQLIYVFDGDPDTKVVCEGYSKAFKYLFDLSGFSDDYDCLLAIGTMNGGGHMWNIVRMEDGRNYLVDVTNCDSSSGPTDRLFMASGPSGSLDGGYTFTPGGSGITYVYSDKTRATFSDAQLTLSDIAYNAVQSDVSVREGIAHGAVSASPARAWSGESVAVTVTPEAGYMLVEGSLVYRYNDGAAQTRGIGDSRRFSMPAAPVVIDAEFKPIPVALDLSALTPAQKPAALSRTYTGQAQALLTPPAELPEGCAQVLYSLDDGASWSDAVPTAAASGEYTIRVKYVGDAQHLDCEGERLMARIQSVVIPPDPETLVYNPPAADTGASVAEQEPSVVTISAPGNVRAPAVVGSVYQIDLGGKAGKGFKSSNKKVASVTSGGLVTPKKPGKVRITFKVGRKKRTVTLTVTDPTVPKRVTLTASGPLTGKKGGTVRLTATLPEGTTSAIRWKSSNRKVATVKADGLVTFKKPGKAIITATCVRGGKKAKVKVRVSR